MPARIVHARLHDVLLCPTRWQGTIRWGAESTDKRGPSYLWASAACFGARSSVTRLFISSPNSVTKMPQARTYAEWWWRSVRQWPPCVRPPVSARHVGYCLFDWSSGSSNGKTPRRINVLVWPRS